MSNELNILIVEDNKSMSEALAICLSNFSIGISGLCTDGDQVLPFLERNVVNTIIMDINMPNMDGITTTKLVKELYPEIRVFGFSNSSESFIEKKMLSSGADGFYLKSKVGELMNAIMGNHVNS